MARYLAEHGPLNGTDLAVALKLSSSQFWTVAQCHWFDITGKGWFVTAEGRREAGLST